MTKTRNLLAACLAALLAMLWLPTTQASAAPAPAH